MKPLLHRFEADAAAIASARRSVRAWLDGIDADAFVAEELIVVTSEMCAHAVARAGHGEVTVRGWIDDDAIVLEVEGLAGDRSVRPLAPPLPDPLADGAPGQVVVRRMCDRFELIGDGGRERTRCTRRRWTAR